MKKVLLILTIATAFAARHSHAQQPSVVQRVAEDAIVFDRVAQASNRDLPRDLLMRIIEEDIDLLRGKRQDGTYAYATFERFDSGRVERSFSIQPHGDNRMESVEIKGDWIYRLILEVPGRKLLLRKNRPVWVERVDLDYVSERGNQAERRTIDIKQWLQPGDFRPVDLPVVARRVTVRVVATVEQKGGYGNLDVSLVKARIVDNPDSPYGDTVASAKAVQRALENGDVASLRTMAQRMRSSIGGGPVVPTRGAEPASPAIDAVELQEIEDLLTGTDQERRRGLDRLRQLIRRSRQ